MKKNWVKIRGIIGLFVFIITLVFTKIATVYNIFPDKRLLVGFILFMIMFISLALFTRYYMERNKSKK